MKAPAPFDPGIDTGKGPRPVDDLIKKGLLWTAANTEASAQGAEKGAKKTPEERNHLEAFLEIFAAGTTHEFFYHGKKKEKGGKKQKDFLPLCSIPAFLAVEAWKKNVSKQIVWVGKATHPSPFLLEQLAGSPASSSDDEDRAVFSASSPGGEDRTAFLASSPDGEDRTVSPASSPGGEDSKMRLINASVFTDPPDRKLSLWTIETSLRSKGTGAVVAGLERLSFTLSRRMALAAEEGGALGLFVRPWKDRNTPGASVSRWRISPLPTEKGAPSFELELLRCKGKQPAVTLWTMEMATDDEETISMHIFPMVVERAVEKVARKAA